MYKINRCSNQGHVRKKKKCVISTRQDSCYWFLVFHRKELKPKEKFPHKLLTTGKYDITLALNVPLKYNLRKGTAYPDQNISVFRPNLPGMVSGSTTISIALKVKYTVLTLRRNTFIGNSVG